MTLETDGWSHVSLTHIPVGVSLIANGRSSDLSKFHPRLPGRHDQ